MSAGSGNSATNNAEAATGGSVEPPTSTPVDPPQSEGVASCRTKLRTPGSVGGSGGGETIDFQLFTPNNKEKCIIYSEKHDCAIPDYILTDRFGIEYNVQGCGKKQLIFWYNRVSSGPFDHSKSFPIFVPGSAPSEEPAIEDTGGGSVTMLPNQTVGNSGMSSGYRVLTGVSNPRIDYDKASDRLRLAYGAGGTSVYVTVGEPRPIWMKRLASAGEEENQPMPFTMMYLFGAPTLVMQKTTCEFPGAPQSSPPAPEEDDLAKGVVCDTDGADCSSTSTKIFTGDLSSMGDFDDLTIVTEFVGGDKGGNGTSPPSKAQEKASGSSSAAPTNATKSTSSQTTGAGAGAMRWMLWLNQNKKYQDVDTGRGGMVYQSESNGGGFAKTPQGSGDTGKPPATTGEKCAR